MKNMLQLLCFCVCLFLININSLHANISSSPNKTVPMRTDADISRAVRGAFAADRFLAAESAGVSIQMDNGVATLSGTVSTDRAKNEIGAKARGVGGVRQVVNNIQVHGASTLPKSPTGIAK